jgi:hypothetical protein
MDRNGSIPRRNLSSTASSLTHLYNPTDDSMTVGPGIYDNYKGQVNDYGETIVYKRDCGQLVPKTATTPKTDWCDGSATRSSKTKKKEASQK